MKTGKVHIYTGSGKGKTTAALGLAVRAAGADFRISIYQFIKSKNSSELKTLKKIKNIRLEQCGRGCFIRSRPTSTDIECAQMGLAKARRDIMSGKYDLVILDEVNVAVKLGLVSAIEVLDIVSSRPDFVEIVLTGRGTDRRLVACADYVTRFVKVKHPFDKGLLARRGIEH